MALSTSDPPTPGVEKGEADLEAPSTTAPAQNISVPAPAGHNREVSEVSYADMTPPANLARYTVADLTGESKEMLAEDDVLRSLEQETGKNKSARSILMPELKEADAAAFEKADDASDDDPVITARDQHTSTDNHTLRDLTAQLMTANDELGKERNGLKNATEGTAAARMADKAAAMFSSLGHLPEGVTLDEKTGKVVKTTAPVSAETKKRFRQKLQESREKFKNNRELFVDYIQPQRKFIKHFWWIRFQYIVFPFTGIAALLFYFFDNPPHGKLTENDDGRFVNENGITPDTATTSWWLLFVVRQTITLSFAKMSELFVIDFLAMKTGFLRAMIGPYVSLWIVQSQGWPFLAIAWGVNDMLFLQGSGRFVNHWLYFQNFMHVFNEANASGNVLSNTTYRSLILCSIGFGAATAVKRVVLSNVMGKRLVVNYGEKLENLMQRVLLITEIAGLAKKLELGILKSLSSSGKKLTTFDLTSQEESADAEGATMFGSFKFGASDRLGMMTSILGEWSEPESLSAQSESSKKVTIASLLHFRRALTFVDAEYPFSFAYGLAKTRADCVDSGQVVFSRLTNGEDVLTFDVLAPLVLDKTGKLDRSKMKKLCRLLRPTKEGTLSRIDFIRSIDNVYKDLRTLVASIESSSQIEKNYESLVNTVHYFCIGAVGAAVIGVDFQAVLVSISALFVGVGFIIGGACASFFEGLLMVFVRRPFDVGDRISVQDVTGPADGGGSAGWIVEKVDLYSTTIRFATTRELATVTNGELARCRIINMQRSRKAFVYLNLKFGIDVSHEQVDKLRSAVEEYISSRPQEWVSMAAFRMTEIMTDQGYVAYIVVLQHQDSWQNIGNILTSRGKTATFVFEKSRELKMRYIAPSLPVELTLGNKSESSADSGDSGDTAADAGDATSIKDLRALFGESKKFQ